VEWNDVVQNPENGITFESFIGIVFSFIENYGEVKAKDRRKGVARNPVSVEAIDALKFIRVAVRKNFLRASLTEDKVVEAMNKTIISFTTKVYNSLRSAIKSAYEYDAVKAREAIDGVIKSSDLRNDIEKVVRRYAKRVVKTEFDY
jgi:hypothetical protein